MKMSYSQEDLIKERAAEFEVASCDSRFNIREQIVFLAVLKHDEANLHGALISVLA